jgi:hypothetical protein
MKQNALEMYAIGSAYGNQKKQDLPSFRGNFPLLSSKKWHSEAEYCHQMSSKTITRIKRGKASAATGLEQISNAAMGHHHRDFASTRRASAKLLRDGDKQDLNPT